MTLVSLTFDDALPSHLDVAAPMLEQAGFRGTFYVNLNAPAFASRMSEWGQLARRGHELGNHTIFHPAVAAKPYITEGNAIENYTEDRMRIELETANRILGGLDGATERSFAYPCSNRTLGKPGLAKRALRALHLDRTRLMSGVNRWPALDVLSSETDYSSVVAHGFYAARGGGYPSGYQRAIPPDRFKVPCLSADNLAQAEIWKSVDDLRARTHWIVLVFHGIGSDHRLFVQTEVFRSLLERLSADQSMAVKPFLAAAKEIWPEAES